MKLTYKDGNWVSDCARTVAKPTGKSEDYAEVKGFWHAVEVQVGDDAETFTGTVEGKKVEGAEGWLYRQSLADVVKVVKAQDERKAEARQKAEKAEAERLARRAKTRAPAAATEDVAERSAARTE